MAFVATAEKSQKKCLENMTLIKNIEIDDNKRDGKYEKKRWSWNIFDLKVEKSVWKII